MPSKCEYYHKLRDERGVAPGDAKRWLKANPPPRNWRYSAWRWAFENMEVA